MRLLLINPRHPESFWSFRWATDKVLPGRRTVNPPLGLATLAALCPPHWQVTIVDENIERIPMHPQADLVGICGMAVQYDRQRQLLDYYRNQGYSTVAGGSYASLCPEQYADCADSVVTGEAEYIWPAFCRDFESGTPQKLYRETGHVDLRHSPAPRFDLLKPDGYTTMTLQFSRGCPFRCEFCDIIVMFGRKPRHKELEQVGRELDALRNLGVRNVFFVDDNLIGHKEVAKSLLRFLCDYQRSHDYAFNFGTEASLNLAQDEELMRLFRAANFTWVFIGIESPDPETLKATLKTQNTREDPLESVRRIYSHGIDVLAGFIIGFDQDTTATFDLQYEFIMHSGIQAAMVGLLTALPRTPLYDRLSREGRLRPGAEAGNNTRLGTNMIPKRMPYAALVSGYRALYERLLTDRGIADRIRNKLKYMHDPAYSGEYTLFEKLVIVARLFVKGVLPGGPPRVAAFLRSIPWFAPRKLPLAVVDWIAGLSMRDYVQRHFGGLAERQSRAIGRLGARIQNLASTYIRAGSVALSLPSAVSPVFSLHLKGFVDRRFLRRMQVQIERLMRKTPSSLTLYIGDLRESALPELQRLLDRLSRHGDRVSVYVNKKWRNALQIDASVFHLLREQ